MAVLCGRAPYNSFGNCTVMRVSPCAWVMDCGFYARIVMCPTVGRNRAALSAQVTHDHPEGIKGTAAVTDVIFVCRYHFDGWHGEYERPINDQLDGCKERIWKHIQREYGYDLSRTLDEIRPGYQFNEACQETVPQAIIAFLRCPRFD